MLSNRDYTELLISAGGEAGGKIAIARLEGCRGNPVLAHWG